MEYLRSKAPLRLSFAGGGTDVSPYPEERGGAVLNCTINKFAYATLAAVRDGKGRSTVHSLDYNLSVDYDRRTEFVYDGQLDLVKAALKVLLPKEADGERADDSLELFLHSDAPPGTGLGSSSTMTVALVGAFQHYLRRPWTPYEVAELAYRIEREEFGIKGGRQDQYAAAFGGFNFMEFEKDRTIVTPLRIPGSTLNELAYRLLLCYTGTSHYSGDIIERQQAGYAEKRSATVEALDATRQLALDMKAELLRGNLDEMGRLLDQGWQLKKRFTDGISTDQIDHLYERARQEGVLGGKLVGAGGICSSSATSSVGRRSRRRSTRPAGASSTSPSSRMGSRPGRSGAPPSRRATSTPRDPPQGVAPTGRFQEHNRDSISPPDARTCGLRGPRPPAGPQE